MKEMNEFQQATFFGFVIIAILTGLGGYISRIAQKFEDKKDDVKLRILPLLKYNLLYILKIFQSYNNKNDYIDFEKNLNNIIESMEKEISSGNVLLSNLDINKLNTCYWNLHIFKKNLEDIKNSDQRKIDLVDALKKGNDNHSSWLKVNPVDLKKQINEIISDIDTEITKYTSWSKKVIILIIVVGIILGINNYYAEYILSKLG